MLTLSNNGSFLNFFFIFVLIYATNYGYALFAVQNERRQLDSLDGLWTFVREPPNSVGIGLQNQWASLELALFENSSQIPVPSAFNDLTADSEQRDHVGWVWYQRKYFLSHFLWDASPNGRRTILRFESVNYYAFVFVNGKLVTEHCGGHLPFQVEVQLVDVNLISVAVNNTLSHDTIPPGDFSTVKLSSGRELVSVVPSFDFFNYAGILRSVYLWHLPPIFIRGIQIRTDHLGSFSYRIDVARDAHPAENIRIRVLILQSEGAKKIYEFFGSQNSTTFAKIDLWWPRGMGKPTLYTAEVRLESLSYVSSKYLLSDVYRETFGFRTVTVDQNRIYINGRPFYCHGFGMHEDIGIHGRGFDRAAMVKDMNTFEWLNGNCYRTSHYPYAEERAYWADRRGIAVITEVPAVGIWRFNSSALLKLHAKMIAEMVSRDRNHPSVIMWSLSNEPKMPAESAPYKYFKNLVTLTKQLDATRPVTVVFGHASAAVKVASLLDVICVNEYFGWYRNIGMLGLIRDQLVDQIRKWRHNYTKPVILSEYGAEAISGFNEQPSVPFSEQYQAELIQETGKAVDELRCSEDIAGEMLWNFADFMTAPSVSRAIGNHKGVLTRERKPKLGAYAIQKRYKAASASASAASSKGGAANAARIRCTPPPIVTQPQQQQQQQFVSSNGTCQGERTTEERAKMGTTGPFSAAVLLPVHLRNEVPVPIDEPPPVNIVSRPGQHHQATAVPIKTTSTIIRPVLLPSPASAMATNSMDKAGRANLSGVASSANSALFGIGTAAVRPSSSSTASSTSTPTQSTTAQRRPIVLSAKASPSPPPPPPLLNIKSGGRTAQRVAVTTKEKQKTKQREEREHNETEDEILLGGEVSLNGPTTFVENAIVKPKVPPKPDKNALIGVGQQQQKKRKEEINQNLVGPLESILKDVRSMNEALDVLESPTGNGGMTRSTSSQKVGTAGTEMVAEGADHQQNQQIASLSSAGPSRRRRLPDAISVESDDCPSVRTVHLFNNGDNRVPYTLTVRDLSGGVSQQQTTTSEVSREETQWYGSGSATSARNGGFGRSRIATALEGCPKALSCVGGGQRHKSLELVHRKRLPPQGAFSSQDHSIAATSPEAGNVLEYVVAQRQRSASTDRNIGITAQQNANGGQSAEREKTQTVEKEAKGTAEENESQNLEEKCGDKVPTMEDEGGNSEKDESAAQQPQELLETDF